MLLVIRSYNIQTRSGKEKEKKFVFSKTFSKLSNRSKRLDSLTGIVMVIVWRLLYYRISMQDKPYSITFEIWAYVLTYFFFGKKTNCEQKNTRTFLYFILPFLRKLLWGTRLSLWQWHFHTFSNFYVHEHASHTSTLFWLEEMRGTSTSFVSGEKWEKFSGLSGKKERGGKVFLILFNKDVIYSLHLPMWRNETKATAILAHHHYQKKGQQWMSNLCVWSALVWENNTKKCFYFQKSGSGYMFLCSSES